MQRWFKVLFARREKALEDDAKRLKPLYDERWEAIKRWHERECARSSSNRPLADATTEPDVPWAPKFSEPVASESAFMDSGGNWHPIYDEPIRSLENGYYWLTSERASTASIGQFIDGNWYLINEVGPKTLQEIERCGWDLGPKVLGLAPS